MHHILDNITNFHDLANIEYNHWCMHISLHYLIQITSIFSSSHMWTLKLYYQLGAHLSEILITHQSFYLINHIFLQYNMWTLELYCWLGAHLSVTLITYQRFCLINNEFFFYLLNFIPNILGNDSTPKFIVIEDY